MVSTPLRIRSGVAELRNNPDVTDSLITVIDLVRTKTAISRPDIGRISNFGRSIVSQRVEEAIELGLLVEGDLGESNGGRAPRVLEFNARLGAVYVAVFGAKHVGFAVTDLNGEILSSSHHAWDIAAGPEKSLSFMKEKISELAQQAGSSEPWAVVVGVPGPVEFSTGKPVAPPIMPGWNAFDIRAVLEPFYGAPTFVDNDVNLMALGEAKVLSRTENMEKLDLIFVKVGSGIGAGILSAGKVHRGANGAAGDIGHTSVAGESSAVCRCGQVGCLEAVAGGWALVRDLERQIEKEPSGELGKLFQEKGYLIPPDIATAAKAGDSRAVEQVIRSARTVANTVASLVSFYNPHIVVVGGSISEAGDLFLAALRQVVYSRSLPLATRDLKIAPASEDHQEGILGAAQLAIGELFSRTWMRTWLPEGSPRNYTPA
jgi:predicted NBD/HSP70 family sugar kinase